MSFMYLVTMGNTLSQYRAAIGLFNRVRFTCSCISICDPFVVVLGLLLLSMMLLLYKCGDIELNPGPPVKPGRLKSLSVCHLNIRSLNISKLRAIRTAFQDLYDVITISETFLNADNQSVYKLPGYHDMLHRDRPAAGGGLAVFIRESIGFKRLYELECPNIEVMWFRLNSAQGKIMLCNVYRPPQSANFWNFFDLNLDRVKDDYNARYILILGDLNADFNTPNGKHLVDLCANHNLTCHIDEPTRITATTSACLDQIISNMPNFVTSTSVMPPVSTNDHCTVAVNLGLKIACEPAYQRHIWQYKQGDYPGFRQALSSADWDNCFNDDVDESCTKWTETFLNTARAFIPNKCVTIRPNDQPWYTNELRLLKRKVKRLFHKAKKTRSVENWERYKVCRNEYQSKLDEAELSFKTSQAESLTNSRNSKQWWGTVNKLLGKGGNDSYPAMKSALGDSFVTENKAKADLFNSFFLSHSNIDTTNANLPDTENEPAYILNDIVVTEPEVLDLIKCIDPSKATGPDGISPRLLKEAGMSIVPSLTRLFNLSLSTAKVPSNWKKANVIPIHKKDEKNLTNNYRPISLLSVVSKLLERVVFKHVFNFLNEHELLTKFQSGFIPGDSTVNQLAFLYHTFCKAIDHKKDVRIVFCDISKAFDRVWHDGLIFKLGNIGIRGVLLDWFRDYLHNRLQSVLIRGQQSDWGRIKAGVPQGSVLGPLLFLIYIDDLVNGIQSNIRLFADDTTLYITVDDPDTACAQLNGDLDSIRMWADQWLVDFNPAKTKTMTISNKAVQHPPLYFNNTELKDVAEHKHLGLTLTDNLSWSAHVKGIVQSASKMCDVLKQFKYKVDRQSLEAMYFTFIRPKLEYACQVWDDCSIQDKQALENVQLNAARIVTGA